MQPLALVSYTEGMREQGGRPGRIVEHLPADPCLAEELGIEPGGGCCTCNGCRHVSGRRPALPMLLVHRVSHDRQRGPVERVRSLYRRARFSVATRLSGSPDQPVR